MLKVLNELLQDKKGLGLADKHPRRMLRYKGMVQCTRIAFGLSSIYELDEALRINISANKTDRSFSKKYLSQQMGTDALSKALEKVVFNL